MEFRTTLKSNRQQFVVVLYSNLFKKVTCLGESFSFSECMKKIIGLPFQIKYSTIDNSIHWVEKYHLVYLSTN